MSDDPDSKCAQMRDVLERISNAPERSRHITPALGVLAALLNADGNYRLPPQFQKVGAVRTREELGKLMELADKFANHLESLHQPAINVLADAGLSELRLSGLQWLRDLQTKIHHFDLSKLETTVPGGRPRNNRAHALGTVLAYYYWQLTGKRPTITVQPMSPNNVAGGPFLELVREFLTIARMKESAEDVARQACAHFKLGQNAPPET